MISEHIMIFQDAFDHVLAPVDEYQMQALRNAALCGIIAFAFIIVGVNQLLSLFAYLFSVAFVCVTAWLYTLTSETRNQIFGRIRDVITVFWRKCVDEAFDGDIPSDSVNATRRRRQYYARDNDTGDDDGFTNTRVKPPSVMTSDVDQHVDDESRRIDLLAKDFTGLFSIEDNQ